MRINQSVCYPMVKPADVPLATFVPKVAEMGYSAIELWTRDEYFVEAVALARKHGLAVATMNGHADLTIGLNDPTQHDRIEAELRQSIDIAADLGIPGVICFSGSRREGTSAETSIAITADGLRRVAPYAEAKGVNLNLELLNSLVDHPGYECNHSAWGAAVCKQVNSPNVKLLFDIYHMQIMEGNIISTVRENIQWIGHFHTAGVPGRRDFDDTQELNYRGICRAIAETGYNLYVGHEFRPKGDVYQALARAFEICDQ
ncbi:MAG: TIM barrel protein [Anaerolineae bacterium]|jgi:hydroxypyruvate isomerase|nr:TIM barrel protein [Anaerolineae bacterium]